MFPVRRKPPKYGIRESSVIRSPGHLAWVRQFTCTLFSRGECEGRIEAAHVRLGAHAGMGQKPGDDRAVPMCSAHHAEQHRIGEKTFAERYGVNLEAVAARLWKLSPHRRKMEMQG